MGAFKPVTISRNEILNAFKDLLTYYERQEQNNNTAAVKAALIEIIGGSEKCQR